MNIYWLKQTGRAAKLYCSAKYRRTSCEGDMLGRRHTEQGERRGERGGREGTREPLVEQRTQVSFQESLGEGAKELAVWAAAGDPGPGRRLHGRSPFDLRSVPRGTVGCSRFAGGRTEPEESDLPEIRKARE